jgi:hypothetical protein
MRSIAQLCATVLICVSALAFRPSDARAALVCAAGICTEEQQAGASLGFSIFPDVSLFDPSIGTLTSAELNYTGTVLVFVQVSGFNPSAYGQQVTVVATSAPGTFTIALGPAFGNASKVQGTAQPARGCNLDPGDGCIDSDTETSPFTFSANAVDLSLLLGTGTFTVSPFGINQGGFACSATHTTTGVPVSSGYFALGGTCNAEGNVVADGTLTMTYAYEPAAAPVPLPPSIAMFLSVLVGAGALRHWSKRKAAVAAR